MLENFDVVELQNYRCKNKKLIELSINKFDEFWKRKFYHAILEISFLKY